MSVRSNSVTKLIVVDLRDALNRYVRNTKFPLVAYVRICQGGFAWHFQSECIIWMSRRISTGRGFANVLAQMELCWQGIYLISGPFNV